MDLIKISSNKEILDREIKVRKVINDLPKFDNMNLLSVVVSYKMFGLNNNDIMQITGINNEMLNNILMSDAYAKMYNDIVKNIINEDCDDIKVEFKRISRQALRNMNELANTSEVDVVRYTANKDILDRAGLRPEDILQKELDKKNQLSIVYIKKENK